jgi:ATP-dependent HslUV protease ATP-binding subunit HslU
LQELTPKQIVAQLDRYIIGQDAAKKAVAIALRNRYRRQRVAEELRDDIVPNNIILIGPTGCGKTEISRRLAQLARAPFIKVEATKFTEVGYVGRDVESIIRDLADVAVNMVKEERTATVAEKAQEAAEERLLDLLLPSTRESGSYSPMSNTTAEDDLEGKRLRTREKLREQLRKGELDERSVEIDVPKDMGNMLQVFGPMGMDDISSNLQDAFSSMMPKRSKKQKTKIPKALEILAQQEAEKLIDMDQVKSEAIERCQSNGIVFIDEIDKIAGQNGAKGPDVSRQGVQRDLLPIVEGTMVSTKHGAVKTDHILFIAAGAFSVAKPSDLIPEMQGRFPIRVELKSLTQADFIRILSEPKNALTKQYIALLESENVDLSFTPDGIEKNRREGLYGQ